MRKKLLRRCALFFALLFCVILFPRTGVRAEDWRQANETTGFAAVIDDSAGLLASDELTQVSAAMVPVTEFASTAFVTVPETGSSSSVLTKARSWGDSVFGAASPYTVFMIDMSTRRLGIYSSRSVYSLLNTGRANTITDNVYKYASNGDYYTCAYTAFGQINTLLEGRKIAQPMKYISNAFLAIIVALLLNYFLVRSFSRAKKPSKDELLGKVFTQCNIANPSIRFIRQSRVYSPPSSSSGGSSGGGGGSSGGGGGGGGGGGHSF